MADMKDFDEKIEWSPRLPAYRFGVQWSDWDEIKELVEQTKQKGDLLAFGAAFSSGVATAGLGLLLTSIQTSAGATWIVGGAVTMGVGLFTAIVMRYAQARLRQANHATTDQVLGLMRRLERGWKRPPP